MIKVNMWTTKHTDIMYPLVWWTEDKISPVCILAIKIWSLKFNEKITDNPKMEIHDTK